MSGGGSAVPGSSYSAFGQRATFGESTNPINGNPFAPGSISPAAPGNPFGTSVGATMSAGNATAFCQPGSSNPFGSASSIFGPRSNTDNGNPFAQRSFGTPTTSSTSPGATLFSGNSRSVFGPSSGFGSKTFASTSASSFSAFGTTSAFSSGVFSHSSATGASNSFGPTLSAFSSTPSPFASGSATSVSRTPTFGTSSSFNFVASKSSDHETFNSRSIFGQPVSASYQNSIFGTSAGPQTTTPIGSIKSGPSVNSSEELRFEHYQPSHSNALTSTAPVGPAVLTPHSKPQTSTAVSTGPGIWGIFPSSTTSLPSITSTQPGTLRASPFLTQPLASNATSTTTGPWGNFSSSKLSTFTFQSQPQASNAISTETGPWGNFSSSKQSTFTFQNQPQTLSAMSKPQPTLTFQSQPQTSSATSNGTGPWGNFSSCTQSTFTFQSLPQTSSAMSNGTGPWGQFPSNKAPLFTSHSSTQTSSALPTGPGASGEFPSSTTSQSQTTTPATFTWTKPEHITAPQKSETHNPSTATQQSGQSTIIIKPSAVASPFGVQPTFQTSVDSSISLTNVQRGISCIPVSDNPTAGKRFSMLTARNLTLGRSKLSFEKYKPKSDCQKVPFYEERLPGTYRAAACIIPRQNPRAWVLNPVDEGALKTKSSNSFFLEEKSSEFKTGNSGDSDTGKDGPPSSAKCKLNNEVPFDATSTEDENFHVIQRNQTDEVAIPYNYSAGVKAMTPKMQSLDYYTSPPIEELAAKERDEPGFCCHVKDFVVGRRGYGSIKFLGETDVRNLDLESLIKFNYREVIVYPDENKKPQVGQGLNKPAEVTLLNVKYIDKHTGKQYVDGPKVDKWRKLLIKKAAEQGAEFVSYDSVMGEWKFMVQCF